MNQYCIAMTQAVPLVAKRWEQKLLQVPFHLQRLQREQRKQGLLRLPPSSPPVCIEEQVLVGQVCQELIAQQAWPMALEPGQWLNALWLLASARMSAWPPCRKPMAMRNLQRLCYLSEVDGSLSRRVQAVYLKHPLCVSSARVDRIALAVIV